MSPDKKRPGGLRLETLGEHTTVAEAERELVAVMEAEPTPLAQPLATTIQFVENMGAQMPPEYGIVSRFDEVQADLILLILGFAANNSTDLLLSTHAHSMLTDYIPKGGVIKR